jgi:hypothetical protein
MDQYCPDVPLCILPPADEPIALTTPARTPIPVGTIDDNLEWPPQ